MFGVLPHEITDAAYGLTIPPGSTDAIARLIDKAERLILDAFPNLPDRVATGRPTTETVRDVIENMVIRVLRNPSSLRSIAVDDGTAVIDSAVSTGQLYLSDDERSRLAPIGRRGNVRSIRQQYPRWPGAW